MCCGSKSRTNLFNTLDGGKEKKQETNGEMHKRIMEEKEAKLNRGAKKAVRTMDKKKARE